MTAVSGRPPILVVGGGPAGLATALALTRHGVPATVIERSAYDDVRIGEHLPPSGVLRLRAIAAGTGLAVEAHAASAGVVAFWGADTASHMD